jgi:hypothetical protein
METVGRLVMRIDAALRASSNPKWQKNQPAETPRLLFVPSYHRCLTKLLHVLFIHCCPDLLP